MKALLLVYLTLLVLFAQEMQAKLLDATKTEKKLVSHKVWCV